MSDPLIAVLGKSEPSEYGSQFGLWRALHACTPRTTLATAPDTGPAEEHDPQDNNGYFDNDNDDGNATGNPGVTTGGDGKTDIQACLDYVDEQAIEIVEMLNQGLIAETDYERLMAENSDQSRNCLDLTVKDAVAVPGCATVPLAASQSRRLALLPTLAFRSAVSRGPAARGPVAGPSRQPSDPVGDRQAHRADLGGPPRTDRTDSGLVTATSAILRRMSASVHESEAFLRPAVGSLASVELVSPDIPVRRLPLKLRMSPLPAPLADGIEEKLTAAAPTMAVGHVKTVQVPERTAREGGVVLRCCGVPEKVATLRAS